MPFIILDHCFTLLKRQKESQNEMMLKRRQIVIKEFETVYVRQMKLMMPAQNTAISVLIPLRIRNRSNCKR